MRDIASHPAMPGRRNTTGQRRAHRPSARAGTPESAGEVAIVGAGPGDPDLLTLKALRLLERADVVVYDRLVGEGIVEYARPGALLIDAGKSSGAGGMTQAAINALLADHAAAGRRVVRLKGGDPFIFGRGGEELAALRARGIAVEVVPGITAAVGCAAAAGVPLTHRGLARAVTLVTGHAREGAGEPDWRALAAGEHTLVIYMGVATADLAARRLVQHGLRADTPACIVERGTMPAQRTIPTTLARLAVDVKAFAVSAPALLIIGEAAAYARDEAVEQAEALVG